MEETPVHLSKYALYVDGMAQLAVNAWQEMLDKKTIGVSDLPISHYDESAYILQDGKLVAFMNFRQDTPPPQLYLTLSYCVPDYRSQGLIDKIFVAVCAEAKKRDLIAVRAGTYTNNLTSVGMAVRQKRVVEQAFVHTRFMV